MSKILFPKYLCNVKVLGKFFVQWKFQAVRYSLLTQYNMHTTPLYPRCYVYVHTNHKTISVDQSSWPEKNLGLSIQTASGKHAEVIHSKYL